MSIRRLASLCVSSTAADDLCKVSLQAGPEYVGKWMSSQRWLPNDLRSGKMPLSANQDPKELRHLSSISPSIPSAKRLTRSMSSSIRTCALVIRAGMRKSDKLLRLLMTAG